MRAVVHARAAPGGLDQTRIAQLVQMMADRGLAHPDRNRQLPLLHPSAAPPNSSDMIFTRAGSASALSRSAICSASSSLITPAATGAQHTGAEMSITGSALGMTPSCQKV